MIDILARPLTAAAFAPYGAVTQAPASPGRAYFESNLDNARPAARPKLWMLTKTASSPLPATISALERHQYSSQTFIPLEIGRWLVVVAPASAQGQPALDRIEAFLPSPLQGVSYNPNVWHAGLHVFDKTARLAVFMWLDGSATDEEIIPVPPFVVREA